MTLNPKIMRAVENLNYRVTVGDVAAYAGLEVNLAQRGLLALASEANGHLQVSEAGEIAYLLPPNFRNILRNNSLRLRLKELGAKVWQVLFYVIRISFGIFLILSIVLIFVAIAIILIAMSKNRGSNSNNRRHGGSLPLFFPHFGFGPNLFWFFSLNHHRQARQRSVRYRQQQDDGQLNFFEAVFSFLFGEGNPNASLEERRWQTIGSLIYNQGGAVITEQISPYLDISKTQEIDEDNMLPILLRFDGYPEVSSIGDIVYRFPTLQKTATTQWQKAVPDYLQEFFWRFSRVKPEQLLLVAGLGFLNLIGAVVLKVLLSDGTIALQLGGWVAFAQSIFWLLLGYGIAFLGVPSVRYLWIQGRNRQIKRRNQKRKEYATVVNQADARLRTKIKFAQEFASQSILTREDVAYTTEKEVLEQEIERLDGADRNGQHLLS